MKIEAAIFDMDGLMFDTERLSIIMWQRIENECGWHFREGMPDMIGMNATAIAELFRRKYGDGFDYISLRSRHRAYIDEYVEKNGVPVKPGLTELLKAMSEMRIDCALATSTFREPAMKLICSSGLEEYFRVMVFGDDVKKSKPDPEIFLTASDGLRCRPEHTLVLEDSANGAKAGCAGGFLTVMIPDLRQPDSVLEDQLTGKFDSLFEVIPLIKKLNREAEV